MRRRMFLTSIGLAVGAGCTGGEDVDMATGTRTPESTDEPGPISGPNDPDVPSPPATDTERDTPTETETEPPTEEKAIVAESHSLIEYESAGEQSVAVRGILRNRSDGWVSYLQAEAQFLDGSNTVIGESLDNIEYLRPGQGWKFNIDYYSETDDPPSAVEEYELSGQWQLGSGDPQPSDLVVESAAMEETEQFGETTLAVQGQVRNTGDDNYSYVEAAVRFVDSDDVIVGSMFSNTENLSPGQGWKFKIDYYSASNTDYTAVRDFDLIVTGTR